MNGRTFFNMTNKKRIKYFTKCTFCSKCDNVEYLADFEGFVIRNVITTIGIKIIHDLYETKLVQRLVNYFKKQ